MPTDSVYGQYDIHQSVLFFYERLVVLQIPVLIPSPRKGFRLPRQLLLDSGRQFTFHNVLQ